MNNVKYINVCSMDSMKLSHNIVLGTLVILFCFVMLCFFSETGFSLVFSMFSCAWRINKNYRYHIFPCPITQQCVSVSHIDTHFTLLGSTTSSAYFML